MTTTQLKAGSLFSGIGGLDLAVEQFFHAETKWHCEYDPEPSKVLTAHWPDTPNLGDITAVDWTQVEPVHILHGGFPCQDLSLAGRRAGMRPGTRSGLWADFKTAIAALRPAVVVIENVRGLLSGCAESDSDLEPCPGCLGISNQHRPLVRALGRVLGDLAALGFDAEWVPVLASDVGAPHGRYRVFVIAHTRSVRLGAWRVSGSGETSAWWPSAVDRGRSRTPVALLPTPMGSEAAKAANHPRLSKGQKFLTNVVHEKLLPTPAATYQDSGDLDNWVVRRERVKATSDAGNGFGMPLDVAVRLLPTPQVADAEGGHASRSGDRSNELLLPGIARSIALLPTPRASRGAATTETMYALGVQRTDEGDRQGNVVGDVDWAEYESAVRRWEASTRPAPAPTRPDGKNGAHRLNPELPEWMMGYPAGWVTDILDRNPSIKACGNGVVPQQALRALEILWPRVLDACEVAA